MKLPAIRRLDGRGFAHHFILPVIAIVAVAGIGAAVLHATHAATPSSYYTSSCINTTYGAPNSAYHACTQDAQILLDGIQHHKAANVLKLTVYAGSSFKYGPLVYLLMNGLYGRYTATAVTSVTGNKNGQLTSGHTGSWQSLCTAAAAVGTATDSSVLNFAVHGNDGVTGGSVADLKAPVTNAAAFKYDCGTKVSTGTTGTGTGSTGGGTGTSGSTTTTTSSSGAPTARLGIFISAENGGSFSTISGQKPDIANTYLYWNSSWPSTFVSGAEAAGATPYVELEPWTGSSSGAPQFSDIVAGKYDSWLTGLGNSVKSLGKPVIFTFAHEFNVSGQYPWAEGDTGSCGSSSCTPAQWIAAWDHVESVVNKAASGHAYWMWAPNADTGGTTTNPTPWWPGASEVQMVGVDGYPDTQYGSQFGTFSGEFGPVFSEIHTKTSLPIFISETDLAPLGSSGYETIPNFIKDMAAAGGSGVLEWEDGSQKMTSTQWTQLDQALTQYVK